MFGLLGAPDVDWSITFDGGGFDFAPGATLRATIALRPHKAIEARRVMVALVGTEEYQYTEREHAQTGSSSSRTWGTTELARQEIQLLGPVTIVDHQGNIFTPPPGKDTIALCRCGQSQRKPFCDGAHKQCGFQGAETAPANCG